MTTPELEDALVEFVSANTSELRFRSNIETDEEIAPHVYCAFIPRNVVGEIVVGEITTYPAIIIRARQGSGGWERELVTVEIIIGTFDPRLDQQGSRDCLNLVERLKSRFREQSIVRERFPIRMPLNWQVNKRIQSAAGGEYNAYPYYFAEMQIDFDLPVMSSQFESDIGTPDVLPGRLNVQEFGRVNPLEAYEDNGR